MVFLVLSKLETSCQDPVLNIWAFFFILQRGQGGLSQRESDYERTWGPSTTTQKVGVEIS